MQPTHKKILFTFLLIGIFSAPLLAACSGPTVIDVNIDPTTGAGNIVVNPPPEEQQATQAPADTSSDMSQVALFAIIVILLLGVMAIVFSVARRPRRYE